MICYIKLPIYRPGGLIFAPAAKARVPTASIHTRCIHLHPWQRPGFPLHPAFELLTPVHKSDYLFGYFSQHVGGAFHDIKQPFGNWTPYFDKMEATPEAWLMGSPVERYGIACQEPMAADDPKCLQLRRSRGENTSYWRSVLPEFSTAYINGRYDPFDGTRGACCERVRDGWAVGACDQAARRYARGRCLA